MAADDNDAVWRPCENVEGYGARDYDDVPRTTDDYGIEYHEVQGEHYYDFRERRKTLDALGHVAYFLLVLGCLLVALKWRTGWLLYIAGDVMWVWLGWQLKLSSVVLWQFVFIGIALYGLWSWA